MKEKLAKSPSEGPSHVLFSAFGASSKVSTSGEGEETKPAKKRIDFNPRLETDYISRRKKSHESASLEWKSSKRPLHLTSPWEGVSSVEKDLIQCCEGLPDDFYQDDPDENDNDEETETDGLIASSALPSLSEIDPIAGVLAKEKECRFAAILARGCHTMASRSLAMAILERTLEAYLEEEAHRALLMQKQNDDDESTSDQGRNGRSTRGSPKKSGDTTNDGDAPEQEPNRRFRLFFATGGLRILNQWLLDASSYEPITPSTVTKGDTNSSTKKAHSTRPIALSILLFLEHIPFDKKIVTNSKINKQVQKLGKKLSAIQEANEAGEAPKEDLEYWTVSSPKISDEGLVRILEAVDAVKASWREKAKTKKQQPPLENPFESLQAKIQERLKDWKDSRFGEGQKPNWYRSTPPPTAKNTSPKRKAASQVVDAEQLMLQKKIKEMQSKRQENLKQLREKLRKHNQNHAASSSHPVSSWNKTISWKDGSLSQVGRNKEDLEDVFVFGKDLPSFSITMEKSRQKIEKSMN